MIYVIINEYGSYADYGKDILCASTSKEKATLYLNIMQQLSDKCHKLYSEEIGRQEAKFFQDNYPYSNNYLDTPYDEYQKAMEQFKSKYHNFQEELYKNALGKYNLSRKDYDSGILYEILSITEVEEK